MPYATQTSGRELAEYIAGIEGLWVTGITVTQGMSGLARIDLELSARDGAAAISDFAAGWISCDRSLPRDDSPVLVSLDGDVSTATHWGGGDWSISPPPTHWQKMPGPATNAKKKRSEK